MHLVFLERFNNYFNRILKVKETFEEYIKGRSYFITPRINVDIQDGLQMEQIVNWAEDWTPDYALLMSDDNKILSKWFIIEWTKIRFKQYKAILKSDVLANYRESVLTAPIFVEKAMLKANDPLIFNNEGMTYNQIKTKEALLKDKTNIGWIVGYYAQNTKDATSKTITTEFSYIEGSETVTPIEDLNPNIVINFGNDSQPTYAKQYSGSLQMIEQESYRWNLETRTRLNLLSSQFFKTTRGLDIRLFNLSETDFSKGLKVLWKGKESDRNAFKNGILNNIENNTRELEAIINANFGSYIENSVDKESIEELENMVVESEGKKYRLSVFTGGARQENVNLYSSEEITKNYINALKEGIERFYYDNSSTNPAILIGFNQSAYVIKATPVNETKETLEVTINNNRNHCNDAPYDMFCIPYDRTNKLVQEVVNDAGVFSINNFFSLAMAKGIATESGGVGASNTYVYDVQLLPYCPIKEVRDAFYQDQYKIKTINGFAEGKDYSIIKKKSDNSPVSIMFWATQTSGTFDIDFKYYDENNPIRKKVESETTFLRLCSPNYNGVFEFNPIKNGGVRKINVDYTYKPFNPYIHLNPDFGGLYGEDYNDSRGLILGGDFSIATLTDAWANYELTNKNYQQMFDRGIANMDYNNKLGLISSGIELGLGSITGGITGAVGGSIATGSPVGAVGGALAGGLGTLGGGLADIAIGQASFRENKDYKIDMFGYQLGNIKALPQGIAKTTAFTFNNKVFPFVELYTCTDREKEALKNKIIYNGMTVMAIGRMIDYLDKYTDLSWFQGKLIRLDISEDSHIVYAIADELNKGVFVDEY